VDPVAQLYEAFARRDGAAMAALYAPDATFEDPAFGRLTGDRPGLMWRMLTERGEDLEVQLVDHAVEGDRGRAHWLADYTFSQTGRRVHNDVRAEFVLRDGLIAEHTDAFSFHAWARQALGPPGLLLGWTPVLRGAVRRKARAQLESYAAGR
jgi:ketosteroid isomerase-like protein